MRRSVLAVVVLLSLATASAAQQVRVEEIDLQTYLELLQGGVREERAQIVGEAMTLGPDQSAAFWPIYAEYESASEELFTERNALIERYAENFNSMTDATADELANTLMALDVRQLELSGKYYALVKEAIGGILAARFLQVNNQVDMLARLQIATQVPLIKARQ